MKFGGTYLALGGLWLGLASPSLWAYTSDDLADLKLAYKLFNLSQSANMRANKYVESEGTAKSYNSNDGNSFLSNTTYHSYVWSYCRRWQGPRRCSKWLPPYVSPHGEHADRSPLEGIAYNAWVQNQGAPRAGAGGTVYGIWQFQTRGALLDRDGKIDEKNVRDWKIMPNVASQISRLGERTAQTEISKTLDSNTGDDVPNTMPNMEALRMMASRWTRMYFNRLASNLGEQRIADKGIEFGLGESRPSCGSYLDAMRSLQQKAPYEDRLKTQGILAIETRLKNLQTRYRLCLAMNARSLNEVNPVVQGEQIRSGSPNTELVSKWKTRVNLAMITNAGLDPNSVPHPSYYQFQKSDYATPITAFKYGGQKVGVVMMTPQDQINTYNRNLKVAAQAYDAVAARNPFFQGSGAAIMKNQIAPGSRNMIELNGFTPDMKNQLAHTRFPRTGPNSAFSGSRNPETQLENSRAELIGQNQ